MWALLEKMYKNVPTDGLHSFSLRTQKTQLLLRKPIVLCTTRLLIIASI